MKRRLGFGCTFARAIAALSTAALASLAMAQVAPINGSHYAAQASDTGFAGAVNSQGGYGASIPLDLPPARGGLPIPLSVVYGGRQVGAAGLGWDVPLSYIYHDTTTAHRRPVLAGGLQSRERWTLSLAGSRVDLVQSASVSTTLLGQRDGEQLEAHKSSDTIALFDGNGRTYTFDSRGASGTHLANGNLYVLTSITGPGHGSGTGNTLKLNYQFASPTLAGGGTGLAINLAEVRYNTHPTTANCVKSDIVLTYDSAASQPLALTMLGGTPLVRTQKLTQIAVDSLADCSSQRSVLRTYKFAYQNDVDTQLPRLQAVTVSGQQGTPEASVTLPVASYQYGAITDPGMGTIVYSKVSNPEPPPTLDHGGQIGVSFSIGGASAESNPNASDALIDQETQQLLVDLNGDGLPDFIRGSGGTSLDRHLFTNKASSSGFAFVTDPSDPSVAAPMVPALPLTHVTATEQISGDDPTPYAYRVNDAASQNDTRVQYIDMNGDGRIDIVEAKVSDPDHWLIHLNTPDPTDPRKIVWKDMTIPIADVRAALNTTGLLPVGRTTTVPRFFATCWVPSGTRWVPFTPNQCDTIPMNDVLPRSITEFALIDVNGDGYPDFVFNAQRLVFRNEQPTPPSTPPVGTTRTTTEVPADLPTGAGARDIMVMYNVAGAALGTGTTFAPPVKLIDGSIDSCGLSRWEPESDTANFGLSDQLCGFEDVNGDGILDRVTSVPHAGNPARRAQNYDFSVRLGTGDPTAPFGPSIALPGPPSGTFTDETLTSARGEAELLPTACNSNAASFHTLTTSGLRDINGDGIPDYIYDNFSGSTHSWTVAFGTGTGFSPAVAVTTPVVLLDDNVTTCAATGALPNHAGANSSATPTGMFNLDGSGQPEVLSMNGTQWDVYRLTTTATNYNTASPPGIPQAGRLIGIDNGYGAVTHIGYDSAKRSQHTLHQLPYPEIVATHVEVDDKSSGTPLVSSTEHAYGNARPFFDPAYDGFRFPGYTRTVELRNNDSTSTHGVMTITDTYNYSTADDAPTRLRNRLRAGRVSDTTTLAGDLGRDPVALLTTLSTTDSRRISGSHIDYSGHPLTAGATLASGACTEVLDPYAAPATQTSNDTCIERGFLFASGTFKWRGTPGSADPAQSTQTLQTSSTVDAIDDFGRVTSAHLDNDLARNDDDLCIQTVYATPTGTNERVLNAPVVVTTTDCGSKILKQIGFEYDTAGGTKLPAGKVSNGFVTAQIQSRRDLATGAPIGGGPSTCFDPTTGAATSGTNATSCIRVFDATYDTVGNVLTTTKIRDDGATATTTVGYDASGLGRLSTQLTGTNADGSALATELQTFVVDPLTLLTTSNTDVNGTIGTLTYDGFSRPTQTSVTPTSGASGVLSTKSYSGFAANQSGGRSVVSTRYTDPVAVSALGTTVGRTSTTFLDSLGRVTRSEVALGADYGGTKLIVGQRTYDPFSRVLFQADPFPSTDSFASSYGTTHYFNDDGTPSCDVRGSGQQTFTNVTNLASEIIPTCYTLTFGANRETVQVLDGVTLTPGGSSQGARSATSDALGHVLEQSVGGQTPLSDTTFVYDAFGHQIQQTRYQSPSDKTLPQTTAWHFDSLGQLLELDEPAVAPHFITYDTWGNALTTQWCDTTIASCASGAFNRRVSQRYDAANRLLHVENATSGAVDPATINDYVYDVGFNSAAPSVTATNTLGHLSKAIAPTSAVTYSYDPLGRTSAEVFTDTSVSPAKTYVQKHDIHADGTLQTLHLQLPDASFNDEHVNYVYDSSGRPRSATYADGTTTQSLFDASSSGNLDVFGRVTHATIGGLANFSEVFASTGRRLPTDVQVVASDAQTFEITHRTEIAGVGPSGSPSLTASAAVAPTAGQQTTYVPYDALSRELERGEVRVDGNKAITVTTYDALGRIQQTAKTTAAASGTPPVAGQWNFSYDGLDNIISTTDSRGASTNLSVAMSYQTADRERLCSVGYAIGAPTTCNVSYDGVGNITSYPAPAGTRSLTYFPNGSVKTITSGSTVASFAYDASGAVQQLTLTTSSPDVRHDKHFGGLISQRDEGGKSVITRTIPALGTTATRHGPTGSWTFAMAESRGTRVVTDQTGKFVQKLDYEPFGDVTGDTGTIGTTTYTNTQWNDGDALQALGIVQLGARMYDPRLGRFLSRDPLFDPHNPNAYAFAGNDPVNSSDPSGTIRGTNPSDDGTGDKTVGGGDGDDIGITITGIDISSEGASGLPLGLGPGPSPVDVPNPPDPPGGDADNFAGGPVPIEISLGPNSVPIGGTSNLFGSPGTSPFKTANTAQAAAPIQCPTGCHAFDEAEREDFDWVVLTPYRLQLAIQEAAWLESLRHRNDILYTDIYNDNLFDFDSYESKIRFQHAASVATGIVGGLREVGAVSSAPFLTASVYNPEAIAARASENAIAQLPKQYRGSVASALEDLSLRRSGDASAAARLATRGDHAYFGKLGADGWRSVDVVDRVHSQRLLYNEDADGIRWRFVNQH